MFMRPRIIAVASMLLVSPNLVNAAVFNVTAGDVAGLSDAIEAANANDEADAIILEAGIFTVLSSDAGGEYFAHVSSEISISGAGDEPTLIQRPSSEFLFSFLLVENLGSLTLNQLTIRGGGGVNGCGGAITVSSGGKLTIRDSELNDNATRFSGGAICNLGGNTIIENSIFKGNEARNSGGAIINMQSGKLEIADSFFVGNEAGRGGALHNENSEMIVKSSVIVSNTSSGSGGGISVEHSGSPSDNLIQIQDSTIESNKAVVDGGGLDLHSSNATISRSTISNNSASRNGGGVQCGFGTLNISNSTISGNSAGGRGGGIESLFGFQGFEHRVDLNNLTITDNTSGGEGGGIYNAESKEFRFLNSIVAGNSDANGPSDCVGRLISSGYNLVQTKPEDCVFNHPNDIIGEAPLLGPLVDNGGSTWTHALATESPAIDAGNPAPPGSNGQACELTDQRGAARNCDIGAYEFNSQPPDTGFRINAGLNDAWFDSATAGQGFFVVVYPRRKQVFLSWFTYDTQRPPEDVEAILGEPGHRWLTAQGPYGRDTAVLDVFLTAGGVFDKAEPMPETAAEPIGTITIIWHDCENGTLSYELPDLGLMGSIEIRRITPDNVALCKVLSSE